MCYCNPLTSAGENTSSLKVIVSFSPLVIFVVAFILHSFSVNCNYSKQSFGKTVPAYFHFYRVPNSIKHICNARNLSWQVCLALVIAHNRKYFFKNYQFLWQFSIFILSKTPRDFHCTLYHETTLTIKEWYQFLQSYLVTSSLNIFSRTFVGAISLN